MVDLDTLHLTLDENGFLEEAEEGKKQSKKPMLVLKDKETKDIEAFTVPKGQRRHVRDTLVNFGGDRHAIKRCLRCRARIRNCSTRTLYRAYKRDTWKSDQPCSRGARE